MVFLEGQFRREVHDEDTRSVWYDVSILSRLLSPRCWILQISSNLCITAESLSLSPPVWISRHSITMSSAFCASSLVGILTHGLLFSNGCINCPTIWGWWSRGRSPCAPSPGCQTVELDGWTLTWRSPTIFWRRVWDLSLRKFLEMVLTYLVSLTWW